MATVLAKPFLCSAAISVAVTIVSLAALRLDARGVGTGSFFAVFAPGVVLVLVMLAGGLELILFAAELIWWLVRRHSRGGASPPPDGVPAGPIRSVVYGLASGAGLGFFTYIVYGMMMMTRP